MKSKFWFLILGSILILSLSAFFLFLHLPDDAAIAEIYQNGVLIQTVDISNLREPLEICLKDDGKENCILLENGQVSMKSANCPDKLCVRQGTIQSSLYPIVCLPNKVTIQLHSRDDNQPDAVAGKAGGL